jgi:hypothetical protein
MPSRQYAAVCERAQRARLGVPDLIRRALPSPDDEDD